MPGLHHHLDRPGPTLTDDQLLGVDAALGRLSSWWLSDPCVERIRAIEGGRGRATPSLLDGEFAVLFQRITDRPWLQPAFAVPLRWTTDPGCDESALPSELQMLARHIRENMPRAGAPNHPTRFRLGIGAGCPSLADLDMPAESAGAVLYAALRCAMHAVSPSQRNTASAKLGALGIESVTGIEDKCRAAARIGIREIAVARTQPVDATRLSPAVTIRRLDGASISEQLANLTTALDAPPTEGTFEQRRDWYNRTPAGSTRLHSSFYAESLVRDFAHHIREKAAPPDIDTLVLFAGRIIEPLLLATETLRAERVILLHADDGEDSARERSLSLLRQLSRRPSIEPVRLQRYSDQRELHGLLHGLLHANERIGIDITPGPKDVAIYLERFARAWQGKHKCVCTYIASHTENGRGVWGVNDQLVVLYPEG